MFTITPTKRIDTLDPWSALDNKELVDKLKERHHKRAHKVTLESITEELVIWCMELVGA